MRSHGICDGSTGFLEMFAEHDHGLWMEASSRSLVLRCYDALKADYVKHILVPDMGCSSRVFGRRNCGTGGVG